MNRRHCLLVAACLLVAMFGFAASDTPTGDVRQITVRAHKYAFDPASIKVRVGEHVELTLIAEDKKHGIVCKDLGIEKTVFEPGHDGHVTFTAEKPGTYAFKCASWCGFGHGRMVGEIVVSEK